MNSILDLIGNTPIVEVPAHIHGTSNTVLAKLEYFNPTGSFKDRMTTSMINAAEEKGVINKDTILIEPTSGNTGISLAFVCSIKKYQLILTMPESMSIERRKLVKHLNAKLVLTKKELGFQGAIDEAYKIAKETPNSLVLNQYNNEDNWKAHLQTGKEIYEQTNGKIDIFVAGVGTGGCITGVSSFIKERKNITSICVQPEESDILSGGSNYKPHSLQGIGPNFIPGNFKRDLVDGIFYVSKEQAYSTARRIAKEAGIISGVSTGANAFCAFEKAKEVSNQTILFMACDLSERYASSDLFED